MSNSNNPQGYVLKVRHPDTDEWLPIPILYQTMYQAYRDYCETNGKPVVLDEETYYTVVGELQGIKNALQEYVNVLNDPNSPPLSLAKGGTGVSVANLAALLNYLGLTADLTDATGTKFPTTVVVKEAIDTVSASIDAKVSASYEAATAHIDEMRQYVDTSIANYTLSDIGITAGTGNPPANAKDGDIFIKYSTD